MGMLSQDGPKAQQSKNGVAEQRMCSPLWCRVLSHQCGLAGQGILTITYLIYSEKNISEFFNSVTPLES
jgi:hypothetical protein